MKGIPLTMERDQHSLGMEPGSGNVVWTERDLYAVIGELFVKNQMAEQDIRRLTVQVMELSMVESDAEDVDDASGSA